MASGRTNDEIALYVAQTIAELEEYLADRYNLVC